MQSANISGLEALPVTSDWGDHPSPFDDSGVQYVWDSTSLGLLKTCPRKYQLTMVLNWQPKRRSHHLEFGILYHTGIELYLKSMVEAEPKLGYDAAHEYSVHFAIKHVMLASKDYEPGLRKGVPDNTKTRYTLIRALVWYFEHYKHSPMKTLILPSGKPAVELSFRFEIGNDLLLSGHLDQIVSFGSTGNYVRDHKTTTSTITGASAKLFFDGFNPDNQMTLYTTAANIAMHAPVNGVIIDATQLMIGGAAFNQGFSNRNKRHLDEFLQSVFSYRKVAEFYTAQGFFPMNENSCGNYGGCAFREICAKSPQVREAFLRTDFTQDKPWNPLEPR